MKHFPAGITAAAPVLAARSGRARIDTATAAPAPDSTNIESGPIVDPRPVARATVTGAAGTEANE